MSTPHGIALEPTAMYFHDRFNSNRYVMNRPHEVARIGITTLELIGCVAAIGTGLWLGAMHVGFDLREAWNAGVLQAGFTSLELEMPESENDTDGNTNSDLSDSTTERHGSLTSEVGTTELHSMEIAQHPTVSVFSNSVSDNSGEQLEQELNRLREAIKRLEQDQTGTKTSSVDNAPSNANALQAKRNKVANDVSVGERTLIYWNKLNAIMAKEEQMRTVPAAGLTATNAGAFLSGRGKAYRYAANAMRGQPTQGVDPAVGNLAHDIASWYARGGELSDRAAQIMNSGSTTMRQGPMGKQWQTDERQHQNELRLINQRGDFLRKQMTGKYKLSFPDLQ